MPVGVRAEVRYQNSKVYNVYTIQGVTTIKGRGIESTRTTNKIEKR